MAAPKQYEWFVYLVGDCTEAAQDADYTASYDAEANETTVIVYAPMAESAQRIAGRFGAVLDWVQITEAEKAEA